VTLRAAGLSDVGRSRETNQDQYVIDATLGLYAVADGMGGHAAGEVASRLAVDALAEAIRASRDGNAGQAEEPELTPPRAVEQLKLALNEGNRRICESMLSRAEWRGMGTTMVAMLDLGNCAVIGHVGDSRAYLLRDQRLERLTSDHSLVNEQVKQGLLSDAEARRHPMRNIVTRALGNHPHVDVEVTEVPVQPGDLIMLCSDGLNSMLVDSEIEAALERNRRDPGAACRELVDLANARGGEDNITVVVIAAGDRCGA
jgi:protein phosphatase